MYGEKIAATMAHVACHLDTVSGDWISLILPNMNL